MQILDALPITRKAKLIALLNVPGCTAWQSATTIIRGQMAKEQAIVSIRVLINVI